MFFMYMFKIQFFRTDGSLGGPSYEVKNHKVDGNVTETIIRNLPQYSVVRLRIAALNEQYQGEFSQPVGLFLHFLNWL